MQEQKDLKIEQMLNSQVGGTLTTGQNKELIKTSSVLNTPFTIVSQCEEEHFVVMGNYRLTDPVSTYAEAYDMIESRDWRLIMGMCIAITETGKKSDLLNQNLNS